MAKSLCTTCRQVFKSVSGFDKHRTGNFEEPIYHSRETGKTLKIVGYTPHTRRCMTVKEMEAAGMLKNAQGWWIASAYEKSAHTEDEEDEIVAAD